MVMGAMWVSRRLRKAEIMVRNFAVALWRDIRRDVGYGKYATRDDVHAMTSRHNSKSATTHGSPHNPTSRVRVPRIVRPRRFTVRIVRRAGDSPVNLLAIRSWDLNGGQS